MYTFFQAVTETLMCSTHIAYCSNASRESLCSGSMTHQTVTLSPHQRAITMQQPSEFHFISTFIFYFVFFASRVLMLVLCLCSSKKCYVIIMRPLFAPPIAVSARTMSGAAGGSGINKAFVVVGGGTLTAAIIYVS